MIAVGVIAAGSLLVVACASAPDTIAPQQAQSSQDVARALALYSDAWAARDTDAILARHADETEFHLVTWGSTPARNKDQIRAAFDAIFVSNPDYGSTVRRVRLGSDFAIVEYDIQIDAHRPAQAGGWVFTPSGRPYQTPAVDIIIFENGLVTKKITYLDTETIRANSAVVERVQR
jgi:ketosteroid isomerase-like protein